MAAKSEQVHCYILKKTTQGEKDVTAGLNSNDNGYHKILSLMGIERTNVQVNRGEFMQPLPSAANPSLSQTHKYHLFRDPTITVSCPQSDVATLTLEEYQYLNRSEIIPERRFAVYELLLKDKERKDGGRQLAMFGGRDKSQAPLRVKPASFSPSVGCSVLVPSYGPYGSSYYGVVKWVGLFEGREELIAGVELEEEVEGCTDGVTKQGVRYFKCPPERGLFYQYHSLHPDDRERSDQPCEATSPDTLSPVECTPAPEEDKALHKQLAKKARLSEKEETSKEKMAAEFGHKRREIQGKTDKGGVDFDPKDPRGKKVLMDGDTSHQEIAALKDQIKKLSLDLEQERKRRQAVEMELAFERRKNLDIRKDCGKLISAEVSQGPRLTALRSRPDLNLDWRINRKDVMKIRTLGGGAWGLVYEGWYNGHAVAIKEPHLAIMSEDTNKRMEREINIMALIQHPNLVRFVGAVMDEDAKSLKLPSLLVTELMDIDLRSAYKKHELGTSKLPIFRDVAYALHYLHEHQEPIIHRDVSAPNVLLEALPNDMWRAKVSDFGSANIAKYSKTAAEGAIIYSAPETFPSSDPRKPLAKQTTKIDTFSFGILVCEVITCQQPNPETRHRIIEQVRERWRAMYDLVVECVCERPEDRLSMGEVLKVLNSIPNNRRRHNVP